MVGMYHSLFNLSLAEGYLDFQFLIMIKAAMNICVHIFVNINFHFPCINVQESSCRGCAVAACLVLWENPKLFSRVIIIFLFPPVVYEWFCISISLPAFSVTIAILIIFWWCLIMVFLYSLDTNLLSDTWFAVIFFSLFRLFVISFLNFFKNLSS